MQGPTESEGVVTSTLMASSAIEVPREQLLRRTPSVQQSCRPRRWILAGHRLQPAPEMTGGHLWRTVGTQPDHARRITVAPLSAINMARCCPSNKPSAAGSPPVRAAIQSPARRLSMQTSVLVANVDAYCEWARRCWHSPSQSVLFSRLSHFKHAPCQAIVDLAVGVSEVLTGLDRTTRMFVAREMFVQVTCHV